MFLRLLCVISSFRLALALLLLIPLAAVSQETAQRIVSINLCTDQLLLMLAEPERIVSVSHLAADPNHSFMAEKAGRFPPNHAELEELLSLKPDLVLAHTFSPPDLLRRLRGMEIPVEQIPEATDLEGIRASIRQVAGRLGEEERGEALIQSMDEKIVKATAALPADSPRALFYHPNGYTNGAGTLQDTALRLAGWRNAAAETGLRGFAPLDLEALARISPVQLFTSGATPSSYEGGAGPGLGDEGPMAARDTAALSPNHPTEGKPRFRPSSAAERLLDHPVVRRAGAGHPSVEIDYRHWICGGPMIAEAVRLLVGAHTPDWNAISSSNRAPRGR